MSLTEAPNRDELLRVVEHAVASTRSTARRFRGQNRTLVVAALVAGTVATLLAGIAAARATPLADSWAVTCWIVAVFSAAASLCTGLIQQLSLTDRVAVWDTCAGRLHALSVAIRLGDHDATRLLAEYQAIIEEYPACFAASDL